MAWKLSRTVGGLVALVAAIGCRSQTSVLASDTHPPEVRELEWADLPKPPGPAPQASPATLTASDGTGLELVTLHARAKVEGPLAFTELRLEFENPSPRVLEGTFSLTLPRTAKVHRFAMKIGDAFQEGEIVEEQQARQTYEAYLHRRVDPALLEQAEGNRFRARVFPIAAKARKEIVLSYSETLESSHEGYRLALQGMPTLDELDVRVAVGSNAGAKTYHLKRELFTPDRDLSIPATGDSPGGAVARSGDLAAVRIRTPAPPVSDPIGDLSILVDTSASRTDELAREVAGLRAFLKEAPVRGVRRVRVLCFDQELAEIYDGPASGFDERHASRIVARGAGGATDFTNALAALAQNGPRRVLLLSDGLATAGRKAGSAVKDQSLGAGVERLDVALSGSPRDAAMGNQLAASGRRSGIVLERGLGAPEDRARLASQSASPVRIRVPNSRFVYPEVIPATAIGGETVVFAELTKPGPFVVTINGEERSFGSWVVGSVPLLARRVAGARIDKLKGDYDVGTDTSMRDRIRRRMVSLSREHGVLGPFTSLLVLETDADYARFGIDRRSPYEFLAIDDAGTIAVASHPRPAWFEGLSGPLGTVPLDSRGDPGGLDMDRDSIPDAVDRCPRDPETFNGFEDQDGCPDKGKVIISGSDIMIIDRIQFRNGTDKVAPESMPIVDALVTTLKHHPEFLKVEVSGHTDSSGGSVRNKLLSERRARAVLALFVKMGVEPDRLVAVGYGDACPITREDSEADREKNRRVEFKILETEDGPTGVSTCAQQRRVHVEPWIMPREARQESVHGPRILNPESSPAALEGDAAAIQKLVDEQRLKEALSMAVANRDAHPRDALAWVGLGNVYGRSGEIAQAARAYGSLIDLRSDSAEMRRAAGGLLEFAASADAAKDPNAAARALDLAVESYRAALERRPDHPTSYRLLAFALARQGNYEAAFRVLYDAHGARFRGDLAAAKSILDADIGVIGAAWAAKDSASDVRRRLTALGVRWPTLPSLRFVLSWETDASDVNLYVKTRETWRSTEFSGSNLRDGYGPEQLIVDPSELPARIGVKLTRRGAQGDALGKVDIVYVNEAGNVVLDARPFALQREGGYAALGEFALDAN